MTKEEKKELEVLRAENIALKTEVDAARNVKAERLTRSATFFDVLFSGVNANDKKAFTALTDAAYSDAGGKANPAEANGASAYTAPLGAFRRGGFIRGGVYVFAGTPVSELERVYNLYRAGKLIEAARELEAEAV